jgi:hypothetical protein
MCSGVVLAVRQSAVADTTAQRIVAAGVKTQITAVVADRVDVLKRDIGEIEIHGGVLVHALDYHGGFAQPVINLIEPGARSLGEVVIRQEGKVLAALDRLQHVGPAASVKIGSVIAEQGGIAVATVEEVVTVVARQGVVNAGVVNSIVAFSPWISSDDPRRTKTSLPQGAVKFGDLTVYSVIAGQRVLGAGRAFVFVVITPASVARGLGVLLCLHLLELSGGTGPEIF